MSETESSQYDSVLIAEYLLALAYSKNKVLNITKVQKFLYMAYGFFLSDKNRVLISEQPKVWPYGPVFPKTREKVSYSDIISIDDPKFSEIKKDNEVTDFFNHLIDNYSKYSASQLSEWSHSEDSPWDLMTKQKGFNWNAEIDDKLIKDYFSTIKF
ncbi:MAG: DUF4065 domain-containing protein [Ekhidna sp.]|nr:DUF4065 domain-containing protein [Ekhidna sp.]